MSASFRALTQSTLTELTVSCLALRENGTDSFNLIRITSPVVLYNDESFCFEVSYLCTYKMTILFLLRILFPVLNRKQNATKHNGLYTYKQYIQEMSYTIRLVHLHRYHLVISAFRTMKRQFTCLYLSNKPKMAPSSIYREKINERRSSYGVFFHVNVILTTPLNSLIPIMS